MSPGRSGDFKEELRVEALGRRADPRRPLGAAARTGWELQDAPVMVPAARLAEALRGVVSSR